MAIPGQQRADRRSWRREMPRFIGKRTQIFWWELAGLIVLVLVVLLVLELTNTAHIFS
jgi:hypothetical protein